MLFVFLTFESLAQTAQASNDLNSLLSHFISHKVQSDQTPSNFIPQMTIFRI